MVYAGEQILRVPEVIDAGNSQTMNLLEGYLNINPTGTGGAEIAIVDSTALESGGGESKFFVDLGKSGTGQISVYIVRQGDTLSEIAEMFGVPTNTIVWANDIKRGLIKEGQEIVIPPISGVIHTVKSGDTLQSIATKYKANLEDILTYGDFASNAKIIPGDVIIVPNGVIVSATVAISTKQQSVSVSTSVQSGYYFRPIVGGRKSQGLHGGDNAVDLAAPFGTPILASANGKVIVSRTGGYYGGYGTYIVISHPRGTQTIYAHLDKNYVSVGQQVEQGQVIGTIGMTGRTTGPHVHFGILGDRNPF